VCGRGADSILRTVDEPGRVKMVIDLEVGDPIRGDIAASGGPARSFYGWLELAAAMNRAREHAATGAESAWADRSGTAEAQGRGLSRARPAAGGG
jgi:hypothetical protein